jgi:hypothetical protein
VRNSRRAADWRLALFAACLAAGTARAQKPTPPPERTGFEVLSQRAIAMPEGEEAPWLTIGGSAAFIAGARVGLTAFDAAGDLTQLWSSPHVSALPPLAVGDVIVTVAEQSLVAVRQDRNDVAWRVALGAAPTLLFALGDRVGVATGRELSTWDVHGTPGWRASLSGAPATPFVTDGGVAYVGLDDASLAVLDTATGVIQWRVALEAKPESLALGGDRLYLSATNGHLYSLRKERGGKLEWDYGKIRAIRAIGQPGTDDRSVYVALLDNILYAFARGGGSERWHTALPDRPVTGPFVLEDSVIVPLASGLVTEVRKDGRIRLPATPQKLASSPSLQSAAVTRDRQRVLTVTTTEDLKRTLTAWGPPPAR